MTFPGGSMQSSVAQFILEDKTENVLRRTDFIWNIYTEFECNDVQSKVNSSEWKVKKECWQTEPEQCFHFLPADWLPHQVGWATVPPRLKHWHQEEDGVQISAAKASLPITLSNFTYVSSVGRPVEGSVSCFVQPIDSNLVVQALPQPAHIA